MGEDILVSIIMSTYNAGDYLREAIESILRQTYKNFEFIVINDGSTDHTESILSSYNDSRLKVINQEREGLTKSLNKGIKMSKGEYIARQDADDISLPRRIEVQVKFLNANPEIALVGTFIRCMDSKGRNLKTFIIGEDPALFGKSLLDLSKELGGIVALIGRTPDEVKDLLRKGRNCIMHGTVMFRREILQTIGMYEERFHVAQDYEFWLRASNHFKLTNIGEVLYKIRFHKERLSESAKREQKKYMALALAQNVLQKV
jgi:glycosyltransferase involved in cell wall biosynthesis